MASFADDMGKPKTKTQIQLEEEEEIKQAFDLFDTDGEGMIDQSKLRVALKTLGYDLPTERIRQMISDIDNGEKGHVTYDDFYKMMTNRLSEQEPKQEIITAFKLMDDDETGKISFKNLKRVCRELGENLSDEEIKIMITEGDRDMDGEISLQEFFRIMWKTKLF